MTIYEIDSAVMSLIDPETGEIADYETFAALQMERGKKVENVALWVKNLTALSESIAAEKKNLDARKKTVDNQISRLKEYLSYALDGQKFERGTVRVSFRNSSAVQITDIYAAVDYLEHNGYSKCLKYAAPEISKTSVRKLIDSGVTVPGANIMETRSVIIK